MKNVLEMDARICIKTNKENLKETQKEFLDLIHEKLPMSIISITVASHEFYINPEREVFYDNNKRSNS